MTDTEKDGAGKGSALATKDDSPLTSEHGRTEIADGVVAKIAGLAAREVGGVHDLGGSAARKIGSVTQAVGIGDERTQGVAVEVGEKQAAVDLKIVIDYGESIPRIADSVRANIKKRIEAITGLEVTEVNIEVNDLYFPGDDDDQGASERTRVE